MVNEKKRKKKTNWREQLRKFGEKVIRDPFKYSFYKREEYSPEYEKELRYKLKKKYRKMYPEKFIL